MGLAGLAGRGVVLLSIAFHTQEVGISPKHWNTMVATSPPPILNLTPWFSL